MNNVFILPSQYILNRWTKYAKRGYYVEKKRRQNENLKARAARISRMATSLALKCSTSEPLLDDLERALENLESVTVHVLVSVKLVYVYVKSFKNLKCKEKGVFL
jgi:hypothetical protein